jgi:integrase
VTHALDQAISSSRRLRPETKRLYLSIARQWRAFAGDRVDRWNAARVEAWRDEMERRGLDVQTINVRMYALRFASGRLAELEGRPDFAAGAETLPPRRRRARQPLTWDEAGALLDGMRPSITRSLVDVRDRAMILLMLRTGLRVGGLCSLGFGHVKREGMTCVLKGGAVIDTPPIDGQTMVAIDNWRGCLERKLRKPGGGPLRAEAPLFVGLREQLDGGWTIGAGLTPGAVRKIVTARAKAARVPGLRGITPHTFRHTFVSWCRELGIPDWRIALYTGHTLVPGAVGDRVPSLGTYTGDVAREPLPLPPITGPEE